MSKREKLKKYWNQKIVPNRGKIAGRVLRVGGIYLLTGPSMALAFNVTELSEGYSAIAQSCLGDRKLGWIPVPRSYLEGTLCAALLLTCGAAAVQGLGNPTTDAACVALMRTLSEID